MMRIRPLLKSIGAVTVVGGALMLEYGTLRNKFVKDSQQELMQQKALYRGNEGITSKETLNIVDDATQKAGFITGITALAVAACGYYYQDVIIEFLGWVDPPS